MGVAGRRVHPLVESSRFVSSTALVAIDNQERLMEAPPASRAQRVIGDFPATPAPKMEWQSAPGESAWL